MAARVSAKKALDLIAGSFAPRGGAGAVRPASAGLTTAASRPFSRLAPTTTFSKERSKSVYEHGAHRSDAEARIAEVPVVMVDGPVALCDGGGGALGHPLDYIQLASPDGGPRACQYCGIMYQMKTH
ncbi:unnamed protein product [Ectocarpus sp. CCAP 1310/34]|nr:unnamed protein product [Ectocarpus sp. CCAP 1310/34]